MREKLMSAWQMLSSFFLSLTQYYIFSHYQQAKMIVNMTVLDLWLFYKRKKVCGTTFYQYDIQDPVIHTFPRSCFYWSSTYKCCRVLNFFKFFFEGVIKTFVISFACIVQMRPYKCFVDCKQLFLWYY